MLSLRSKAPEGWRSPRRFAFAGPLRTSARSCTAVALRRFSPASSRNPCSSVVKNSNANCPNRPCQNENRKRAGRSANYELRSANFGMRSAHQVHLHPRWSSRFSVSSEVNKLKLELQLSCAEPRAPLPLRHSECGWQGASLRARFFGGARLLTSRLARTLAPPAAGRGLPALPLLSVVSAFPAPLGTAVF